MASERPVAASQPPTLQTRPPPTTPPPHSSSNNSTTHAAEAESPSISAPHARARFEFESGKGNNGTKVLMVEWEDDGVTSAIAGRWTVAWDGQPATHHGSDESVLMPAAESSLAGGSSSAAATAAASPRRQRRSHEVETSAGKTHRIYFLLGVRKQIPSIVTLTLAPYDSSVSPVVWKTNPLPAIFPPGLADAETTKGKGVLHNLWATKRLQRLDSEIEKEAKDNCEGIGIQLAISEREWIEQDFGITSRSAPEDSKSPTLRLPPHHPLTGLGINPSHSQAPMSPSSPLSPGGSRLSEKLKGLKLQTAPADDEVAVPACRDKIEKLAAAAASSSKPATPQLLAPSSAARGAPTQPGMSSIGAVLATRGANSSSSEPESSSAEEDDADEHEEEEEEEQELFALPLSPRSPEMTKSPFSWAAEDTRRYINTARAS